MELTNSVTKGRVDNAYEAMRAFAAGIWEHRETGSAEGTIIRVPSYDAERLERIVTRILKNEYGVVGVQFQVQRTCEGSVMDAFAYLVCRSLDVDGPPPHRRFDFPHGNPFDKRTFGGEL